MEFFKCCSNRKKFLFHGSIVTLSTIKLARILCNRFVILHNYHTKLIMASIGVDCKGQIMILCSGCLSNDGVTPFGKHLLMSSQNPAPHQL
jgi:hypothetical protein